MKRVVVTGASGFIGAAAVAPLIARGFEVHTLGRRASVAGTTAHKCDLLYDDPAPILASVEPSHLLHLAWYAEPGRFWSASVNVDWVAASLRLARAFSDVGGKRMVGAGSCAEYSWAGDGVLDERTTALQPASLYGVSKLALFRLLASAAPSLQFSFCWGRIFFPYGPNEQPGRLLSGIVDGIRANEPVPLSVGHQARDFIHIDDVGGAFAVLLDGTVEGAVNIGTGVAHPVRTFAAIAAAQLGGENLMRPGARAIQAGEPPLLVASVARLADELGFRPSHDLASGLRDATLRWFA